ncbi:hypothetical protein [Halocynthiibacter namhaensis]|uniref:hypothetical protein n=1 Tax=Halocynthiibacter namhaensis TaxID=1290553 RepID=UPI0005792394|nr:hypothetical protein [Halocynthiibacter namhaensis]
MIRAVLLTGLILTAAACGQNEVDKPLVLDGVANASYNNDLGQCRAIAANYRAEDLRRGAIGGAVIGGIVGVADDNSNDVAGALTGVAIGGLIGAAEASEELDGLRRNVIIRCMMGRGHPVIG